MTTPTPKAEPRLGPYKVKRQPWNNTIVINDARGMKIAELDGDSYENYDTAHLLAQSWEMREAISAALPLLDAFANEFGLGMPQSLEVAKRLRAAVAPTGGQTP